MTKRFGRDTVEAQDKLYKLLKEMGREDVIEAMFEWKGTLGGTRGKSLWMPESKAYKDLSEEKPLGVEKVTRLLSRMTKDLGELLDEM